MNKSTSCQLVANYMCGAVFYKIHRPNTVINPLFSKTWVYIGIHYVFECCS